MFATEKVYRGAVDAVLDMLDAGLPEDQRAVMPPGVLALMDNAACRAVLAVEDAGLAETADWFEVGGALGLAWTGFLPDVDTRPAPVRVAVEEAGGMLALELAPDAARNGLVPVAIIKEAVSEWLAAN